MTYQQRSFAKDLFFGTRNAVADNYSGNFPGIVAIVIGTLIMAAVTFGFGTALYHIRVGEAQQQAKCHVERESKLVNLEK